MTFITRWWFQTSFYFHPYLGKMNSFWLIFFQMGWNHQPITFWNFWSHFDSIWNPCLCCCDLLGELHSSILTSCSYLFWSRWHSIWRNMFWKQQVVQNWECHCRHCFFWWKYFVLVVVWLGGVLTQSCCKCYKPLTSQRQDVDVLTTKKVQDEGRCAEKFKRMCHQTSSLAWNLGCELYISDKIRYDQSGLPLLQNR